LLKVVFMGTPGFAVPPLLRLVADGHDVAGVVTQPDRPSGRGREVTSPPVKQSALEKGLKILQPENVNSEESVREITSLAPELIVVVAFGAILRRPLLELPSRGCINLHASLLPRLRGVAPVNWAIVRGEKTTGVTTMWMNEQVDAGEIIFQQEIPIMPEETAGELEERLSRLGSDLLSETLRAVEKSTAPRVPQDIALKSYAPKLKKENGKIDWRKDSATLHNHIRGMTPWPGAQTTVGGEPVKILKARVHSLAGEHTPGSVLGVSEVGGIEVAAGSGSIAVLVIQPAGKKPMAAADFARGRRLSERDRFGT
jgi:methionyl-tRNA formyltransferase